MSKKFSFIRVFILLCIFIPILIVLLVNLTPDPDDGYEKRLWKRILETSEYHINLFGAYPAVLPTDDGWPGDTLTKYNGIKITFTCGWAKTNIPPSLKSAILLLSSHWYQHASPVVVGASVEEMPFTVEALLSPWMPVL